ncbi:MAG: DUF2135 domain-containing protein [Rhodanobacteraceae bacterium]|nr:DUF2135 domain-containing protein [Rhodanobacteraceae bacterium]
MKRLLLSLLALALPVFATALTPLPPPPPPPPPQVWVPPGQGLQPIRLGELDIQIRTHGFMARTTLELRFDNPNPRVLEGEFVFPLAAGQTVAGYALEVNGSMREGVVVDKQTARVAFEETTRRQIDPGLAELTAGNVFRTRLYPIPANGSKRVRLHLESTLADLGDSWRYLLPMQFKETIGRLHVRAETELSPSTPLGDDLKIDPELRFDRSGSAWISEFTRENVRPRSELAFRIPKDSDRAQVEAADLRDPAWRSVIALTDSGRPNGIGYLKPRRIALFYDASASARARNHAREAAAIGAYVRALGDVEVLLVAFRNDADAPQGFKLRGGDASPLLKAIAALPLDGGSSYGAIDLAKLGRIDQVLVIGDGLSNFGPGEAQLKAADGTRPPVFVLHAAQQADPARLMRIARAGGGRVLDLAAITAEAAAEVLRRRDWRLIEARATGGECREISPAAPAAVDVRVTLSARCRGQGELRLRFGDGAGLQVERRLAFGRAELAKGPLAESVHRLWAQAWLAELAVAAKRDIAAMAAIGKRYGVVTEGTSLLVLDRIEDYVRFGVEPKEADLLAEYRRLQGSQPKVDADPGREARLADLVRRWREFRDWHGASYPGIESLLLPMVETEAAAWPAVSAADPRNKAWAQGRAEAEGLVSQARSLIDRWPAEGAQAASRAKWEREVARVVYAMEALRQRRAELPQIAAGPSDDAPVLADAVSEAGMVSEPAPEQVPEEAPLPLPAPPPAPASPATVASSAPVGANGGAGLDSRDRAGAERKEAVGGEDAVAAVQATKAQIELTGWNPDTPYLDGIRDAADPYRAYLAARETHGSMPAFYLDVADFLREKAKSPRLALRVLSNLAELDVANTALTRVLAYRLSQWDLHALAVPQFEYALDQRPEEPQSYRDLALALARQPQADRSRAVDLLWQVAMRDWHGRFPDIELIALHEMNDVLAQAPTGALPGIDKLGIPAELLDPVAVGLRVVLTWDADNTDIDLWVVDPSGDKAVYSQPRTKTGGHMSRDFTGGYGPEVYTIRKPLPGTYVVMANYFGDRRQSLTGPVTIQLEFQTRFGTRHSERAATTRRLESGSQTIEIGKFKVGAE